MYIYLVVPKQTTGQQVAHQNCKLDKLLDFFLKYFVGFCFDTSGTAKTVVVACCYFIVGQDI